MTSKTFAKKATHSERKKKSATTSSAQSAPSSDPPPPSQSSTAPRFKGKRSRSSALDANPFGIEFKDEEQRLRYLSLAKRTILPTRYFDENTLSTLGMLEEVNWLLGRLGWDHFITLRHPAYKRLTLEFLSSVNVEVIQGKHCTDGLISFRLHNRDFALNLAEFNSIFGFPSGGLRTYPHEFLISPFWYKLTESYAFTSSESKESHIHHPCFRYVHRLMAHTIFARGDSTAAVRKSELLLLWGMVNGFELDTGSWLARQFTKVGKASSGQIAIGGLITPIALHLNIPLVGDTPILGTSRIDLEMLINNETIVKWDGKYCLMMSDNVDFPPPPLPDAKFTTVRDKDQWTFSESDFQFSESDFQETPDDSPAQPSQHPSIQTDSSQLQVDKLSQLQESISLLQVQQTRQYLEFKQFRDDQLLHQQKVQQILQDTLTLLRSQHH